MIINKLPQYLINKLKAWEIVERPSSVVKELIENSLDASANEIIVEVLDWWKKLIKITDNWKWIWVDDIWNAIERYATSKISNEDDLLNINSYGFRWEALASISEISKFTIQTKQVTDPFWSELIKIWEQVITKSIPFSLTSWTIIYVEDIFFNTPARLKFLKAQTTEWKYIFDIIIDYALVNYQVSFKVINNWKQVLNLKKAKSLLERIFDVYKKERESNLKNIEAWDVNMNIVGVISDANLSFLNQDQIKIFVNNRPVNDRVIKRALMQTYDRQLPRWEYPLAVLFLELKPESLDVNVHPRKSEIKFLDPWSVFNFVNLSLNKSFSQEKTSGWSFFNKVENQKGKSDLFKYLWNQIYNWWTENKLEFSFINTINSNNQTSTKELNILDSNYRIVWQIRNSFIIIEWAQDLLFADQHAIAERIAFEKMKTKIAKEGIKPQVLLNPIFVELPRNADIELQIQELSKVWFDLSAFSETKLVIYSVPSVFVEFDIDMWKLLEKIILITNIHFEIILDEILATRACKSSIKAWQKLSILEMEQLIVDGFKYIDKLLVCQHWRPALLKIPKLDILWLFDRK